MKNRGNSLVGILVAVAIVILATLYFTTGGRFLGGKSEGGRPDGKGETLIGQSVYAAKDDVCISNLGQVRQAISIATDPVDNTYPQSIEETRLGQQFYVCPVGKEPYVYDPTTGTVKCPHKGHEKY